MNSHSKRDLARTALQRSVEVRRQGALDVNLALDPFDLCSRLGVKVQFVDVSMEGLYKSGRRPRILLSALRPFVRRVFNCAHELGHWAFAHGSTLDSLMEEKDRAFQPNEFLADAFAGFILMPPLGIRRSFNRRGWNTNSVTPEQMYTVACAFGVGYETIVEHCSRSLEMITLRQREQLLRSPARDVRGILLKRPTPEPLVVVDEFWELPTVDLELGTLLLLPEGCTTEGLQFSPIDHPTGRLFRATDTGIGRIEHRDRDWSAFSRVMRPEFVGFSENRHLEANGDQD